MKRFWGREALIGALTAALSAGFLLTAYAETRVGSVRLVFTDELREGMMIEPEVRGLGSGYEVADVEWSKGTDSWKPGKKVTAEVTLVPEDGWEFSGSYGKSSCKVSGADYVSAKERDGELVVKVSYYPAVWLYAPEQAGWSDSAMTKAVWKRVPYATSYQLRLYANGEQVKTLTLEGTSVDLSPYMMQAADYYYEVRGTFKDSSENKYIKPGEYTVSQKILLEDLGSVGGDWQTGDGGFRYKNEDGSEAVSSWQLIMGKWYYFDAGGYAVSGWQQLDGRWYYFDENHAMVTGWVQVNDHWYYLAPDGNMKTGWHQEIPGVWYYLNADGSMAVNADVDGYHLEADGIMQ